MFFLEFALESSLLVLMILGIRKIFMGKIRYAGIYALWLLVLLRFMIPVNVVSTPFSAGTLLSGLMPVQSDEIFSEKNPGQVEMVEGKEGSSMTGELSGGGSPSAWQEEQGTMSFPLTEIAQEQKSSFNWHLFLVSVWLTVSVLLLLWFVMSNARLIQKLKKTRVLYGEKDKVKIYAVSGIQNPCLYGCFQPAIYLPEGLVSDHSEKKAEKQEIEQMITHEYVHYRHGDHIWAMFRVLFISVYWFDPFLWLAVSCSKKDAELFCDETVVRLLGEENRFSYGKMLVRLAGDANWGEFRYPMISMSRRGKEMERRIRAISDKKRYSRWIAFPLALLMLVAAGVTCSTGMKSPEGGVREEEHIGVDGTDNGTAQDVPAEGSTGDGSDLEGAAQLSANSASDPGFGGENGETSVDVAALERVLAQYTETFTEAVNTGNTDNLSQVLAVGSDIYEQQCEMAQSYYKRGIQEKVKSCSISSVNMITPDLAEIVSKEKIRVFYAEHTTKIIRQKYRYTCEYNGQNWLITKMEEVEVKG